MTITLTYGMTSFTREFAEGSTVSEILSDTSVKARLGLPENVVATVDGRTLDRHDIVSLNDEVLFEKQAASKAK